MKILNNQQFTLLCLGFFLVLPWLNPIVLRPSYEVFPWLISAMCGVLLWISRRRLSAEVVIVGWIVAAVVSALMGLIQYFILAKGLSPWLSQPSPGMVFANLHQRNQFATLTSIGFVALTGWLAGRIEEDIPWWVKYIVLLLALGNAASSSRTGFLQWGVILVLTLWWTRKHSSNWRSLRLLAFQAITIYLIAVITLPSIMEFITGESAGGLLGRMAESSRIVLWSNVITLIAEKPFFGWGWDELKYAHFMTLYPGMRFSGILGNAHNLPLHLAFSLGVPIAFFVCAGFAWWVWRQKPWLEVNAYHQVAWGVLTVIFLHSMLEFP
ncbi:MAG: O-antigen polymerase, partial [Polaromonas sp.]|nr:O-antigen polymerase [Polaromonas sp.]